MLHLLIQRDYLIRETENESYAAFGQATYHATDNLDLTAGLRYTAETRRLKATRLDNRPSEGTFWGNSLNGLLC